MPKYHKPWKRADYERPRGECYDCGLEYGSPAWADVVVPDEFWEIINPTHHEGAGLLCLNCMNARFTALGFRNVPYQIASGPFSFSVRKGNA